MLDHMILTVNDVDRSLAFYKAALKPLHIKFFMPYNGEDGHPDLWGFGDGNRAFFWIKQGKPDPAAIHQGFVAAHANKVDEFYNAAMSAGAKDNISPRARLEYYPGYYAADVLDPDGWWFAKTLIPTKQRRSFRLNKESTLEMLEDCSKLIRATYGPCNCLDHAGLHSIHRIS